MPSLEALVEFAQPWAKFYAKSHVAQSALLFAHLGGMLWGGGLALAADRSVWKLRNASVDDRTRLLAEIGRVHVPCVVGIAIAALSGVLLFAADLETFATSPWYWGKMAAFALLLINGRWLQVQEQRLQAAPSAIAQRWSLLTVASRASMTLWFAVALGGVLLKNA